MAPRFARPADVRRRRPILAIALVALATLAFHLATNGRYGFFRDELYFPSWSSAAR